VTTDVQSTPPSLSQPVDSFLSHPANCFSMFTCLLLGTA
jgi:hypothetical protein